MKFVTTLKAFYPIVLLNILGKLIKKAISNRLQVHTIISNFTYLSQLKGIKQYLTTNIRIFLNLSYINKIGEEPLHKYSCI